MSKRVFKVWVQSNTRWALQRGLVLTGSFYATEGIAIAKGGNAYPVTLTFPLPKQKKKAKQK